MRIEGVDGLSAADLLAEIRRGGRFVFFESCISFIALTLRRPSGIVFLRSGQSGWLRGLPYTLMNLILGWWGLPWGPIYTLLTVANNLAGGCDVTATVCEELGFDILAE